MEELIAKLTQAGLIEGSYIILDELQMVQIEDFAGHFADAINAEDQYSALISADENPDGTTKGYKRFFDAWLDAGIIAAAA